MATIIIPCAGNASRLSLPFSKELLPVAKGELALTSVVDKAVQCPDVRRVIVVVRSGKSDIVDHLERYATTNKVAMVHQHPTAEDAAGAALSALHLVEGKCVMLLPDHVLGPFPNQDPLSDLLSALDRAAVAFLVAPIKRVSWAKEAGVVQTSAGTDRGFRKVTAYAEHPAEVTSYDAVWAAVGFQINTAELALRAMAKAKASPQNGLSSTTLHEAGILGAAAVMIDSFLDIGEWTRYADHWRR